MSPLSSPLEPAARAGYCNGLVHNPLTHAQVLFYPLVGILAIADSNALGVETKVGICVSPPTPFFFPMSRNIPRCFTFPVAHRKVHRRKSSA